MFANVRLRVSRFLTFRIGLVALFFSTALTLAAAGDGAASLSSTGYTDVFCGTAPPTYRPEPVVLPPHPSPLLVGVSIIDFAYSPSDLTINIGDTVIWTNNDSTAHSTTSNTLVWDSGLFGPGETFSFTFTSAGTFPYFCTRHKTMTATITVVAPAPTISGTVTYGNAIGNPNPRFVSNVLLTGAGSPDVFTTTGFPSGTYSLTGFGAGPYTVTPTKTDGVNGITSFDAGRIAQHVAGINTLNATQLLVADTSNNGSVSSFDAGKIAQYVSGGTIVQPNVTGTWRFTPVNRSYASVTSNSTGEDFIALLMGDVSGNWTNTAPPGR